MTGNAVEGGGIEYDRPKEFVDNNNDAYICARYMAKGGFSKVYQLRKNGSRVYCGKFIPKKEEKKDRYGKKRESDRFSKEIDIHQMLKHENIVRLHQCVQDPKCYCLILEYCANKSMAELLKRRQGLLDPEIRYYTKQILSGMKYLLSNNIVHRDIKPHNIMLNDRLIVKIADFGLAVKLNSRYQKIRKTTIYGTPNYISPEMIDNKVFEYDYRVDVWALGCLLYDMFSGHPPFVADDVAAVYSNILHCKYEIPKKMSDSLVALVKRILRLSPNKRPSLDDIARDSFFTICGFTPKSLPMSALVEAPKFGRDKLVGSDAVKTIVMKSMQPIELFPINQQTAAVKFVRRNGGKIEAICLGTNTSRNNNNNNGNNDYLNNIFCTRSCIRHSFRKILDELTRMVQKNRSPITAFKESDLLTPNLEPIVWIHEYVDSTDQPDRCVSYLLNNGITGAFCKSDNTCVTVLANGRSVQYYSSKLANKYHWRLQDCPDVLTKRVDRLHDLYPPEYVINRVLSSRRWNTSDKKDSLLRNNDDVDGGNFRCIDCMPQLVYFKSHGNYDLFVMSNGLLQIVGKPRAVKTVLCPRLRSLTLMDEHNKNRMTYGVNNLRKHGLPLDIYTSLFASIKCLSSLISSKRCFACRRAILKKRFLEDELKDKTVVGTDVVRSSKR